MKYAIGFTVPKELSAGRTIWLWLLTPAFGLGVTGTVTLAQQAPNAGSANEDILQEVVVTAERREEDLQKTPISISVLSGSDLQTQGKTTMDEVLRTVPGVTVQDGIGSSAVFIRGVGPTLTSDSAVSASVDGIYQTDTFAGSEFDLARVEVLRGPQGTLYGRNATAGSVNIITNDPIHTDGGTASIQVGNYSDVRTEAVGNVSVTDWLALRGAFAAERHTGYLSNGANDEDQQGARFKALLTPTDQLRILAAVQYIHFGGHGMESVPGPLNARRDPWTTVLPDGTPSNLLGAQDNKKIDVYGRLDYDFHWATLTYQPSYYVLRHHDDEDLLGQGLGAGESSSYQRTHELRLASPKDVNLQWLVGLYYLEHDNTDNNNVETLSGGGQLAPGPHPPVTLPTIVTANRAEARAVFGQATQTVATGLRLTGGLRYTEDKKINTGSELIVATVAPVQVTRKDSAVTWKAGVEYDLAAHSLLFAQVSKGYKSGGVNAFPSSLNAAGQIALASTYAPETLIDYEIGIKNRFYDNRIQMNATVYYYDYKNQQIFSVLPQAFPLPPVVAVSNAAKSRVYGAEVESEWLVTRNDHVVANVNYNNARFVNFNWITLLYGSPPDFSIDRSNTPLVKAPLWNESLGYDHVFPFTNAGSLSIGGEIRWYSGADSALEPVPDEYQPAYHMSDANIVYTAEKNNWSMRAYINNIENVATRGNSVQLPGTAPIIQIGPPRVYGLGFSVKF